MRTTPQVLVLTAGHASDGPYGVDLLSSFGLKMVEVPPARTRAHIKVRDVFEHRLGYPVDKAVRSLFKAQRSDVILAFLERESIFPAKLKSLPFGYGKKPLATIACWLTEELSQLEPHQRVEVLERFEKVDLIFVFSQNQIPLLVEYGVPREKLVAVPFGFDPSQYSYTPPSEKDIPLVAVGFDRGRDYPTLMAAMRGVDKELLIACKEGNLQGTEVPENVKKLGVVPYEEYKALIHRAQIVVVPSKELAYPTGQTVALEAAATGAAVVVTGTAPMREYFDETTALMPAPGDVDGLRNAINSLLEDQQLRADMGRRACDHVQAHYPYRRMWSLITDEFTRRRWLR